MLVRQRDQLAATVDATGRLSRPAGARPRELRRLLRHGARVTTQTADPPGGAGRGRAPAARPAAPEHAGAAEARRGDGRRPAAAGPARRRRARREPAEADIPRLARVARPTLAKLAPVLSRGATTSRQSAPLAKLLRQYAQTSLPNARIAGQLFPTLEQRGFNADLMQLFYNAALARRALRRERPPAARPRGVPRAAACTPTTPGPDCGAGGGAKAGRRAPAAARPTTRSGPERRRRAPAPGGPRAAAALAPTPAPPAPAAPAAQPPAPAGGSPASRSWTTCCDDAARRRRATRWRWYTDLRVVGAAILAAGAVLMYLSYTAENGLPWKRTYSVRIAVPDAGKLIKNTDVKIGGARVGPGAWPSRRCRARARSRPTRCCTPSWTGTSGRCRWTPRPRCGWRPCWAASTWRSGPAAAATRSRRTAACAGQRPAERGDRGRPVGVRPQGPGLAPEGDRHAGRRTGRPRRGPQRDHRHHRADAAAPAARAGHARRPGHRAAAASSAEPPRPPRRSRRWRPRSGRC